MNKVLKKYDKNILFENCIQLSCPDGYASIFDKVYDLIVEYNKQNNTNVSFAQVKMKFNLLTIYLDKNFTAESKQKSYNELRSKVNFLCGETKKYCKVCGKNLQTTVVETKILKKCFDHFKIEQ